MSRYPYAGAAAHLDEAQLDTVLAALDDAAGLRATGVAACGFCDGDKYGVCADHDSDLRLAARYATTARQLRQETGR